MSVQLINDHPHQAIIAEPVRDTDRQNFQRLIVMKLHDLGFGATASGKIELICPFGELSDTSQLFGGWFFNANLKIQAGQEITKPNRLGLELLALPVLQV